MLHHKKKAPPRGGGQAAVAEKATVQEESIHVMPIGEVTTNQVKEAIFELEAKFNSED